MELPQVAGRAPMVMELQPGTYYWCACGRSKTQPFCDDSHAGTGIEPVELVITETRRVALCMCKQSTRQPICDGTHKRIP